MKLSHLPLTLLVFGPTLWAQTDPAAPPAMPNPKDPAHDALKPFVGTWNCHVKMTEGGQTMEMPGTETFELICDGLWLKSVVNSTFQGQPFQGISLLGYEPKTKSYTGVWADSMGPEATITTTNFDKKAKTWNSKTVSGQSPARSTLVWKDDNSIVETCYKTGEDGKETVVMEISRKRGGNAPATPITEPAGTTKSTTGAKAPQTDKAVAGVTSTNDAQEPGQAELTRLVGMWNSVMRCPTPDGKMSEDKGTETCSTVAGNWVWTDYKSTFMGGPFEGHGLIGYDPSTKKTTTYWIDTASPYLCKLVGTCDPATKTTTASGKTFDPAGEEMTMTEKTTWKDEHTRVCSMTCAGKEGEMKFDITYTRAHKDGDHKIKK